MFRNGFLGVACTAAAAVWPDARTRNLSERISETQVTRTLASKIKVEAVQMKFAIPRRDWSGTRKVIPSLIAFARVLLYSVRHIPVFPSPNRSLVHTVPQQGAPSSSSRPLLRLAISPRQNQILFSFPLLQAQVVPWKLWAAVAGLLAIDVILLLVWTLVDPLSREVGTAILQPSPPTAS